MTDQQRKKKLEQLAQQLKTAKTAAERKRLMEQVDGILESGPDKRDQEIEESWERSRS